MRRKKGNKRRLSLSRGCIFFLLFFLCFVPGGLKAEAAETTIDASTLNSDKNGVSDAWYYTANDNILTLNRGEYKVTGSFEGTVHIIDAMLTGETFTGPVEIEGTGFITGGTYKGQVVVKSNGTISGGSFEKEVNSSGTISRNPQFIGTVTADSGKIEGGTFKGEVVNRATVTGGTFEGKVTNENSAAGKIDGGTYKGEVTNKGTISNGTFEEAVTNDGAISGGTYAAAVTNNGQINGGTYNREVTNNGTVTGNVTGTIKHKVTFTLDRNLEYTLNLTSVNDKNELKITLSLKNGVPANGYQLPDSITIVMGIDKLQAGKDYTYNSTNGELAIHADVSM